jgi:uncharacterized protein (DUF1778 family)
MQKRENQTSSDVTFRTPRRGSEKRKRGPKIDFRVTPDEMAQIRAAADRAGESVGSYVRSCCLNTQKRRAVRRPPVATAQLAQLLGMMGSTGGALQRIAQRIDSAEGATAGELSAALADFRQTASAILQTLGKRAHDY